MWLNEDDIPPDEDWEKILEMQRRGDAVQAGWIEWAFGQARLQAEKQAQSFADDFVEQRREDSANIPPPKPPLITSSFSETREQPFQHYAEESHDLPTGVWPPTPEVVCECIPPWDGYATLTISASWSVINGVGGCDPLCDPCDQYATDTSKTLNLTSACIWQAFIPNVELFCSAGNWILRVRSVNASIDYVFEDSTTPIGTYLFSSISGCILAGSTYPASVDVTTP